MIPKKLAEFTSTKLALDAINPPRFKTEYNFRSIKNVILLCGTKDAPGTCHWAFDNHHVGILYDPLKVSYEIIWFDTALLHEEQLDAKYLIIPPDAPAQFGRPAFEYRPYSRGFAFHALEGALRHGLDCSSEKVQSMLMHAAFSMAAEENKMGMSESATGEFSGLADPEVGNLRDFDGEAEPLAMTSTADVSSDKSLT